MKPLSLLRKTLFLASASALLIVPNTHAKLFDFGVDSENLGKGDWIYFMSQATNKLGGNVLSVTNIPSLMQYMKDQGMNHIIVKAGEGSTNFPTSGPQFTSNLVYQAHAKGLKIFGYTRSYGFNIPGEIQVITNAMKLGADGYVIDAEVEWEAANLSGGPAKATQLCTGVKNVFPTRFLAHSPLPIISYHSTFPYKEFGMYCDAVMPQVYWQSFGMTPEAAVDWMDVEWRNWHNSLTGTNRLAIKPLVPIGQADNVNVLAGEIKRFYNYLKTDPKSVTAGGYRGVNFWRADLHKANHWTEIRTNSIGGTTPGDGSIVVDNTAATMAGAWTLASSATDKYGLDYRYKGIGTGASYLQYKPTIPTAGDYNVYEWHTQGSNRDLQTPHVVSYNGGTTTLLVNQQVNGGRWNWLGTFNFVAGAFGNLKITDAISTSGQIAVADAIKFQPVTPDIIVDNPAAYITGSWTAATSAADKYGADYRYKSPGTGSAHVEFIPNIKLTGNYQVYEWHCAGSNRAVDAEYMIYPDGDAQRVVVNQTGNGGRWNLLGTYRFALGTPGSIRVTDKFTSGSVVIADAIKLVFVSQ
jgi:hypothetical protein